MDASQLDAITQEEPARNSRPEVKSQRSRSQASADPLEGTAYRSIGDKPIGRGSMGEVRAAEHVALGKRVVVKLLLAEHAGSAILVDRMRLEAQVARVVHPNIVSITDVGRTPGGRPFLVMEQLIGRTLRAELAERGHLPVAEALQLARQLLSGLAAVHRMGIAHRDIKPENLFLCDSVEGGGRTLKILDFGIAKVIGAAGGVETPAPLALATREGMAIGTPRFLSPEQAMGREMDHRTDLYAVGIVLYLMLSGRDPFFEHKDFVALLRAHVTERPRPPSAVAPQPISPALDRAVLQALEKKPDDRFGSAAEMVEALSGAANVGAGGRPRWLQTELIPHPHVPRVEAVAAPAPPTVDPEATTQQYVLAPDGDAVATVKLPPSAARRGRPLPLFVALLLLSLAVTVSVGLTALLRHLVR
jgi:serine/threonine-protein kinase